MVSDTQISRDIRFFPGPQYLTIITECDNNRNYSVFTWSWQYTFENMKIPWQILFYSFSPGSWLTVSCSTGAPWSLPSGNGRDRESFTFHLIFAGWFHHQTLRSLKDLGSSRYDLIIDVSADRWRLLQNWNLQINSIIRFSLSAAIVILSHGLLLSNTALSPCNGTSEISVFSLLQEIRSFLGFKSHCLKS